MRLVSWCVSYIRVWAKEFLSLAFSTFELFVFVIVVGCSVSGVLLFVLRFLLFLIFLLFSVLSALSFLCGVGIRPRISSEPPD